MLLLFADGDGSAVAAVVVVIAPQVDFLYQKVRHIRSRSVAVAVQTLTGLILYLALLLLLAAAQGEQGAPMVIASVDMQQTARLEAQVAAVALTKK